MKKFVAISLMLCLIVSLSLAIGYAENETGAFTFWHGWSGATDGNAIAFSKVLEAYPIDMPNIKLDITAMTGTDYTTKLKVAFSAGEGPDIFQVQGLNNMKPLVTSGVVRPLNEMMEKYGTFDDILGGSTNAFTFDGKIYGIPTITGLAVLYCNTELFEKAGVEIPTTWDELLNVIAAFNEHEITPFLFAGKDLWPVMFYYDILAIRSAGSVKCLNTIAGNESFDQEEFIKAGYLLQELTDAKAFNESDLALSWDEGVQKFANGGAAMIFNGTWVAGIVSDESVPVYGKIAITAFPGIGGEHDTDNFGGAFECISISNKVTDDEMDAAFQAISYLGKKMSDVSLFNGNGLPGWRSDELDISTLTELTQSTLGVLNAGENMCPWWDTALGGEAADIHLKLVMQLVKKDITPEEFSKQMEQQISMLR